MGTRLAAEADARSAPKSCTGEDACATQATVKFKIPHSV